MMTDLESFRATVEHRRPGRVLAYAGFTPDLHERVAAHTAPRTPEEYYGMVRQTSVGPRRPEGLPKLDFSRYWENEKLPPGTTINGAGVAQVPSGFYHFWGYVSPLRNATSLAELENYPMEDLSLWDTSDMKRRVDEIHARGEIAVAWVGHIYENAWQIRGYEQFLMDIIERPEWAQCLLDRIAANNMITAVAAARAGADWIRCGDDVANQNDLMFQPETWRRMMRPLWAKIWRAVKEIHPRCAIWYHSDGNIMKIVGDLVEDGVNILNPLQPECLDVDAVHRKYGARLTFDGTIGTQSTMPWGKPADVRRRVKEVIDRYGRNGGLIISPTHVLEPEVPLENIDALFDACREYGTFE